MPKHKNQQERLIESKYNQYLSKLTDLIGNEVTFSDELEQLGNQLFDHKFKGVFPSDKLPKLSNIQPYSIVNLDNSSQPGSHWIALAYDEESDRILVYDSFGRSIKQIVPFAKNMFGGQIVDTDNDAEQRIKEDNCGQRCLAWLIIFDEYGASNAILI